MNYTRLQSPVGKLLLAGENGVLARISFLDGPGAFEPDPAWVHAPQKFARVEAQLMQYFAGERQAFDLPLLLSGTPFQQQVLRALQAIPYGSTVCYAEIARQIGRPRAVRAVGAANARNPLPIVIPCHRVIGKNGGLTGFAGGLPIKSVLLTLEGVSLPPRGEPRQYTVL